MDYTSVDLAQLKDVSMALEENRLKSFRKWPFKTGPCTKEELAKAGFYYVNEDCVRCFVCFKELEGWEETDVPFSEHLRKQPTCYFAQEGKEQNKLTIKQWVLMTQERNKNLINMFFQNEENELKNTIDQFKAFYSTLG